MSTYLDHLTDRDLGVLARAIDKMESAIADRTNFRASQILSPEERHAILSLAIGTRELTADEQARMN